MSQEPCTLFWPRSGFTPTPHLADVAGGHGEIRHAHHHGRALAVLGDAQAVIDRAVAAGRVQPRRAANIGRRNAGERLPVASGELRSSAMNLRHCSKAGRSQRSLTYSSSTRPSVTTTCASALIMATLVPGCSGRW